MKTSLYRYFDDRNRLLYAGVSHHPFQRKREHELSKDITQVRHIELEWFDTRAEATAAERHVIETERPLWNINMRPAGRKCRTTDFSYKGPEPRQNLPIDLDKMWAFSKFWHGSIYSAPACNAEFKKIFGKELTKKNRAWVNNHMGPRSRPKPPFDGLRTTPDAPLDGDE